jgi:predicted nucleotidyltransferase
MIGKAQLVDVSRVALADFCRRRGIRRLALFGSVLRDDFSSTSDIDVLVEFEAGRTPGLIGLGTIELELATLFGGRQIDLHTPASLQEGFRQRVLATAEVQFDSGA